MLNIEILLNVVCECSNVSREQILSRSRKRELVNARFVFYYLGKKVLGLGVTELGKFMGNDHATVLHGQKMSNTFMDINYTPFTDLLRACEVKIISNYQKDIRLQISAPFDVNLDELIKVLREQYRCRVIKAV